MAKKVLIVDDQAHVRNILDFNLKRFGYEIYVAADGETALKMANKESFDVILLDIMLPNMDGVEVLDIMRKTANPTPVIVVSAKGEQTDIIRALKAGARDYIVKPFNMEVLFQKIAKQIFSGDEPATKEPEIGVEDNIASKATQKLSSISMLIMNGNIDENDVKTLEEMMQSYFKLKQFSFVLDLSRVLDMRTLAIGKLVKLQQDIQKQNGSLKVYIPQEKLQITFKEANFYKNFQIFDKIDDLIKSLT